jgi:hypothetical protein
MSVELLQGDCTELIKQIPDASVDAVITDPPYPEIDRDYGRMTEADWHDMMHKLVPEIRRVLKPHGSAVFILQPNFEKIGKMRLWLWKFMVWIGEEWGIVQDAYWMNTTPITGAGASQDGLLRTCIKPCVWAGLPSCYRNQETVLWTESEVSQMTRLEKRASNDLKYRPSGLSVRDERYRKSAEKKGGVTPMNVRPTHLRIGGYATSPLLAGLF